MIVQCGSRMEDAAEFLLPNSSLALSAGSSSFTTLPSSMTVPNSGAKKRKGGIRGGVAKENER